jgi:hypothetical protein
MHYPSIYPKYKAKVCGVGPTFQRYFPSSWAGQIMEAVNSSKMSCFFSKQTHTHHLKTSFSKCQHHHQTQVWKYSLITRSTVICMPLTECHISCGRPAGNFAWHSLHNHLIAAPWFKVLFKFPCCWFPTHATDWSLSPYTDRHLVFVKFTAKWVDIHRIWDYKDRNNVSVYCFPCLCVAYPLWLL